MTHFSLEGRNCVVTGGGTGIGRGIALALAGSGARVAVTGRREAPLRETIGLVEREGERGAWRTMDVIDADDVREGMDALAEELGGTIHVVVANAGTGGPNACAIDGPDRWHDILRTNLDGTFFTCREALRHMPEGGRVLAISSVLGKFGVPGYTAYCASKHGVIGFVKALALEVASRGITVNAICPGWVDTDMARQGLELLGKATGTTYEKARAQAMAAVPIGRILQPDEIGGLCAYLASPASAGVTAQALSICGGQVMDG